MRSMNGFTIRSTWVPRTAYIAEDHAGDAGCGCSRFRRAQFRNLGRLAKVARRARPSGGGRSCAATRGRRRPVANARPISSWCAANMRFYAGGRYVSFKVPCPGCCAAPKACSRAVFDTLCGALLIRGPMRGISVGPGSAVCNRERTLHRGPGHEAVNPPVTSATKARPAAERGKFSRAEPVDIGGFDDEALDPAGRR